jgi:hypothetical protein
MAFDSFRSIRMFDRVMLVINAVGGLGWVLLPNPAARWSGGVSVLAGFLGGIGAERLESLRAKHAAPRQITTKQRQAFIDAVGTDPKGPIGVVAAAPDQEAIELSAQVVRLLRETGWDVRDVHSVGHPIHDGLVVGVSRTEDDTDELALRLIAAFNAAGITTNRIVIPIGVPFLETITILIGPKPSG